MAGGQTGVRAAAKQLVVKKSARVCHVHMEEVVSKHVMMHRLTATRKADAAVRSGILHCSAAMNGCTRETRLHVCMVYQGLLCNAVHWLICNALVDMQCIW